MDRGMCQFLDWPDGLPPASARLRAEQRRVGALPDEIIPDDVDVGFINEAVADDRSFVEDGQ